MRKPETVLKHYLFVLNIFYCKMRLPAFSRHSHSANLSTTDLIKNDINVPNILWVTHPKQQIVAWLDFQLQDIKHLLKNYLNNVIPIGFSLVNFEDQTITISSSSFHIIQKMQSLTLLLQIQHQIFASVPSLHSEA